MAKKTLILWIDACRYDYVKKMPFLSRLAQRGNFGYLKQVFGYNSILASFMTGLYPEEHGQLSAYSIDENEAKVGEDEILKHMPNFIAPYYFNLKRFLHGNDFSVPYVQYKYSKNFNVAQDKFYNHKKAYRQKNLLDILDEQGLSFVFYNRPFLYENKGKTKIQVSFNNSDKNRVKKFKKIIKNNSFDFYFLHLWDLDKYGHEFGPENPKIFKKIEEQDSLIKELFNYFSWEKDNIIIWSDHGMLTVNQTVDLMSKLPVSSKYKFFLDSTMARFWFNNHRIKNKICKLLNKNFSDFGHFLSKEEKNRLKINFKSNRFGEEIFLVNSGNLILPNFFQQKKIKGMHGYDLSNKNEWGMVISSCFSADNLEIIDLLPNILRVLNIKDTKL